MTKTTDAIRYAIDADVTIPHVLGVGDSAWALAVAHDDPDACEGVDAFMSVEYMPSNLPN